MKKTVQRKYSITTLIILFFIFSFAGWLWEVSYHLILDKTFVNRGMLSGPWLPIYGAGSIMILIFLQRFFDRPIELFFMIMGLCGMVEYVTGWFLETFWHTRWWDYREYIFQIQGRVCLIGLLIFGIGGLFIVYVAAPRLSRPIQKMGEKTRRKICLLLLAIFVLDVLYSLNYPNTGEGITKPAAKTLNRQESQQVF